MTNTGCVTAVQWHSFEYGTRNIIDTMARATLTAPRSEDILSIFCFSWPFMSFEAQRKSKYAKLLQFFVTNSRLYCHCWYLLIEWQSFVAILFVSCRHFLAHISCQNLPWQVLTIGFGFTSDWLQKWLEFIKPFTQCSNENQMKSKLW